MRESGHGRVRVQHDPVDFFEDLPRPARPDEDLPEPDMPEWLGPPKDVMGGMVSLVEAVVRTEHLFVGLTAVTAYSTGMSLSLVLAARRGALPQERWEHWEASFWSDRPHRRSAVPPGDGVLRTGLELADGRRTATLTRVGLRPDVSPEPPVLIERGGGGSGGPRSMDRRSELWLWPLPEGDALSLVLQWPDLDVPLTFHRIALKPVRTAAARAVPYWP